VLDANVLGEYLNGTGNLGGPLVASYNDTMNSDKRLYESDKNATMRSLFAQGAGFLDTCTRLMSRAINTVPDGVQLSEPITAMPIKPVNVTYDFGDDGTLMLSGKIRILTPAGSLPPSSLHLLINHHETDLEPESETGSSVFGRSSSEYGITTYFPFSVSGPAIQNATSFSVLAPGIPEQSFRIDSQGFVVPSLTHMSGTSLNVTIALFNETSCEELTVHVAAPIPQRGTLAPKMSETTMVVSEATLSLKGYTFCQGRAVLQDVPTGLISVKTWTKWDLVDLFFINGGQAGW
jgi:hypothetical protein